MATATFGSPIKKFYGEQVSLTTTALALGFRPKYHEVLMYCPTAWRMAVTPRLASVQYFTTAGSTYTDYTAEALDRDDTTDVVLDAMATGDFLYLGVVEPVRGFYFDMDGTNVNSEAADLDWEYCYDVSVPGYLKLTGTVTGALTVGETVIGATSGATAVFVYDDGSTFIIVKTVAGSFQIGEDVDGASQSCNALTAKVEDTGNGFFLDVTGDSDLTKNTQTLDQDGIYSFTLPAVVKGAVTELSQQQLYWYRFRPTVALSANVDVNAIYAINDTTNYGYFEAGVNYQFSLNVVQAGAFELDHTASDTLKITWIMH